jgi:myo-inositol-1(or 4)-monophosphatase
VTDDADAPARLAGDEVAQLDERFAFASQLIREAGQLALDHFRDVETLTITDKGRQDMATEADLETEQLIRERLAERFPEDAFLGEETGRHDVAGSERIWVVDPIDGTQPFIYGLTSWCVSIALVSTGRLELGLVAAPARDELFMGRRGAGATLNGRPIAVRPTTRLDEGILYMGYSPRIGADDVVPIFQRVLRQGAVYYREGSGALGLCYVAAGRLIGYLEPHLNSWDALGALAVAQAAGARTNDFLAGDGLWTGAPMIAGSPGLYPTLLAAFEGGTTPAPAS